MRVLMHLRPDWRELPGGDLVQLDRWAVWLREFGVEVACSDETQPDLRGVDLVHFHNLGRAYAMWATLQYCRQQGVPTVLTPLYWPTEEYENYGRPGLSGLLLGVLPKGVRDRLKSAARWLLRPGRRRATRALLQEVLTGHAALARKFLSGFDALIANSDAERAELRKLLPDAAVVHVVHSGVDAFYWSEDRELWLRERAGLLQDGGPSSGECASPPQDGGLRQGVLCVARFDPQKSQHRLIRALRPLEVPLTLAGPDNPNYPGYRSFCQRIGGPLVTILPRQAPEQLKALYRSCQVHALCSWYETTGLTGLEAGCCEARVVMTDRGGTRDYGGEQAWYADPGDLYSIGRTVERALEADDTPDLHQRVVRHFTWEQSARNLLDAYRAVLDARGTARWAA